MTSDVARPGRVMCEPVRVPDSSPESGLLFHQPAMQPARLSGPRERELEGSARCM